MEAAVAETFGPLLAEFGFLRVDGSEMAPEAWIRYQNDTTALTVLEEIGTPPWVKISRLDNTSAGPMEGEGYSLGHVLSVRAPESLPTAAPRSAIPLRAQLAALAELVRRHGADLLRGDFEVFPRLREVARASSS